MKSFTYVAAIALLTAGTAFAQAQSGAAGANGSTINNSTPTPAAKGPAEGVPGGAGAPKGTMMNNSGSGASGSMNSGSSSGSSMGSSSMNQSSDMNSSKSMKSSKSKAKSHHVASARTSGNDSRENQETMQLNRQQIAGGSSSMNNSSGSRGMSNSGSMGSGGMGASSSNPANSFDNGSPQQAQAGGANCTPDNPSCGTARQNPAINSSPQHRTYGTQSQ
jgi:hypothetical protein